VYAKIPVQAGKPVTGEEDQDGSRCKLCNELFTEGYPHHVILDPDKENDDATGNSKLVSGKRINTGKQGNREDNTQEHGDTSQTGSRVKMGRAAIGMIVHAMVIGNPHQNRDPV